MEVTVGSRPLPDGLGFPPKQTSAAILSWDNATVLHGPLCPYDCRLIRRQGSVNLHDIQYVKGVPIVSVLLLVIAWAFLLLNDC